MTNGSLTLGDLRGRLAVLEVRCRRCERHGRLRLAMLLARYGSDKRLPDLRDELAGDCPHRGRGSYDGCNVYFP